jgi:glycosyltransferase involved in cell wall biosynthesis
MGQPLVSVLMTSYNRERYIAEAIESVLNSSYQNWELIICDDASSDKTVMIASEYLSKDNRIKLYINPTNLGDYPNRNKAASYATGKYLKYVDSDDAIYSFTLERMVEVMEQHPEVALAVSSRYPEIGRGVVNVLTPELAYKQHFFTRNVLDHGPSGTIIRKTVFDDLNGFLGLRNISDFDMWLRISARYPIAEIEHGLVYWREHEGQEINIANDVYLKYTYQILKNNLQSPECPLNKTVVKYLLLRQKKMLLLNLIRFYKQTKDFKRIKSLLRDNGFSLYDYAVLPFLKLYTSPRIYSPLKK